MDQKSKNRFWKRDVVWLITLVLTGLCFRALLLRSQYAVGWDEAHYLQLGMAIARGKIGQGLHPYWSPAYPFLVSLFSLIFSGFEIAGRAASMVCGVLSCLPVFYLTKRIAGMTAATIASAWVCFWPPLAFQSTEAMPESMLILFSVLGIAAGWRALEKRSFVDILSASVCFGLAYLAKPEGAGYFALFMAVYVTAGLFDLVQKKQPRRLVMAIGGLIVFLVIAGPYLVYLHGETGRWTLSSKVFANQQLSAQHYTDPSVNYSHLSEDNTVLPLDAIYHQGDFMRLVRTRRQATRNVNLSVILAKYGTNLFRTLKYEIPHIFGLVLIIVFSLGLFRTVWPAERTAIQLYLAFIILGFWLVCIPLFFLVNRYFYTGLTLCFVWIGAGIDWMFRWSDAMLDRWFSHTSSTGAVRRPKHLWRWIVLIVLLGFSVVPETAKVLGVDKWSTEVYADAVELKEAGLWLRAHASEPLVLMSTNKGVDYYAGVDDIRRTASFTNTDFNRVLSYARSRGVNYMVLTERYRERFPDLMFLFDDEQVPQTVRVIYDETPADHLRVRIFKLLNVE